jgi:hypothetical protein
MTGGGVAARSGLRARFLKGIGDCVLEARCAAFLDGGVPGASPVACTRGRKERRVEPRLDGVLWVALAMCRCGTA